MFRHLLAGCVCLVGLVTTYVASAGEPAAEGGSRNKPAYWKDERFLKPVSFALDRETGPPVLVHTPPATTKGADPGSGGPVRVLNARLCPAQEVATAISKEVGVTVLVQGDLGREKVVVPVAAGRARDVMDELSQAFAPVRWFRMDGKWVLARSAREAALTAMPSAVRAAQMRKQNADLLRALSLREWRVLQRTSSLEWTDMSPATQRVCREMAMTCQYDPDRNILNAFAPNAAQQGGFYLKLSSVPTMMIISVSRPGHTYAVTYPFIVDGKPIYGISPPP